MKPAELAITERATTLTASLGLMSNLRKPNGLAQYDITSEPQSMAGGDRGGLLVVSGFIKTGSSALIDLLRDQPGFHALLPEFKVFHGTGGIIELARSCDGDARDTRAALAACRQRLLNAGRDRTPGYRLRTMLRGFLTSGETPGHQRRAAYDRYLNRAYLPTLRRYFAELQRELVSAERGEERLARLRSATTEHFHALARAVLPQDARILLLNQTIKPSSDTVFGLSLLPEAHLIVVDRDPRDQYVDLERRGRLQRTIARFWSPTGDSVHDFIRWYERRRRDAYGNGIANHPRILVVRFEEFASRPAVVLDRVFEWLGLERPREFALGPNFRFTEAANIVGMWQHNGEPQAMARIREELEDYCCSP